MKQTVSISKEFEATIEADDKASRMRYSTGTVNTSKTMSELLDSEIDKFDKKKVIIKISLEIQEVE